MSHSAGKLPVRVVTQRVPEGFAIQISSFRALLPAKLAKAHEKAELLQLVLRFCGAEIALALTRGPPDTERHSHVQLS
jgi:hypothetical protein